ncbi:hypothetical protein [Lacticaseibacillus paracasei]|uniref:hypothetical protein n=1 Tax=Lacticaseibacillus paracasei TaxID=1597 RepID=UPI001F50D886|nr:hypothetical protein [Lacticaseibacillus paracasei]MCI0375462.1 hypothetical protein [Lacticaseibacillus paracasei]
MKTGDDTFDDIYISKETGKVVGVMYEDVDYLLTPLEPNKKMMSYKQALRCAEAMTQSNNPTTSLFLYQKAVALVKLIYGEGDEK